MNKLLRPAALGVFFSAMTAHADPITDHPNGKQLAAVFAAPPAADFKPTGVTRERYLKLIAGNVDFFKGTQNKAGAIIDPVSHGERQYSTPAFAAAAGLLAKEAGRQDLLEPASRALTCALNALVSKHPADNHSDFYIPLLVHAYRSLKPIVSTEQADAWEAQFKKIDPETMYRADLRGMNWNIVSSSGELLRRHDGLVSADRAAAQMAYLEKCLAGHLKTLTPLGLFEDPGAPMAYDAFSRLWLEDVFADNAYTGANAERIGTFLRTGGLTTLLLLSPNGEWLTGGRSSMHNWTDAQALAICEMNAAYWKRQGREDVAGAFKRAAHLAFESVARWQRPSGELWIIKNHAEPPTRFAYETYSNHSQYNLLPMAMLAIAYSRADESIAERPSPSEAGSYVLDARATFHKIVAAASGYYVEIDTAADPHYNATGLQRVQRAGVTYPALNDTAAPQRAYGDKNAPKAALALGLQWQPTPDGNWVGLGDFVAHDARTITKADLAVESDQGPNVGFNITYQLAGRGGDGKTVAEHYALSADGVAYTTTLSGHTGPTRLCIPTLVNDGAADLVPVLTADRVTMTAGQSTTMIQLAKESLAEPLALIGPRLVAHNGLLQAAAAKLSGSEAKVRIQEK